MAAKIYGTNINDNSENFDKKLRHLMQERKKEYYSDIKEENGSV